MSVRAMQGLACLLMLLLAPGLAAETAAVRVPVSLEYRLLQQVLEHQYFSGPGGSAELLENGGCNQITLTEPSLQPSGSLLQVDARVRAQLGLATPGGCSRLLDWAGAVRLLGVPVVDAGGASIRFDTREAWLITSDGSKINEGPLWQLARPRLQAFLNGFTMDLEPHIASVAALLPEVLPHHSAGQLQAIVNSLALESIAVAPPGLTVKIAMEIEKLAVEARPEKALGAEELQQFEERWQAMDALLVSAVKTYASDTGLQELRDALMDALIESRYRLRDALATSPDNRDDPVRDWFLDSWQALAPVVRQIALEQPGQQHLLWLTLLTGTDALRVLDELGPGIGLDISVDGVRRLARLVNDNQVNEMLRYSEDVDPELQRLYRERFRPEPPRAGIRFRFSPIARAHAASREDRLNRWAPDRDELAEYLPMVGRLLQAQTETALKDRDLPPEVERLVRRLVLAAAWQESCWRQYTVKNRRLEPLRSGSGDVGLMQVNERIWRGIYDQHRLRWDIDYNSQAGIEVLLDYLQKYALRREEHKRTGGLDNLARASYSAYNGGPSQVSRYRRSDVPAAHRKIDAAFWDKYQQVSAGNELGVAKCLGGEALPGSLLTSATGAESDADAGTRWVRAQPKTYFTLQLGAFSQRESGANFIKKEALPDPVHVYPMPAKGGATNYVVLRGSYATREEADQAKARFARFKPWVRSFESLTAVK